MRISTFTIYNTIKLGLARASEDLYKSEKVVSSGKRLTNLSEDPVALVQTLSIKSSLSNLEQLGKNIARGRIWLDVGETVLDHVSNLISDAKDLCQSLNSGVSLSSDDQAFATEQIKNILTQLQQLANTTVEGRYLFAGTKTDVRPFEFDDNQNPTAVSYMGNEKSFAMTVGRDISVEVGHVGEEVFGSPVVTINETNNKIDFVEDPTPALGDESVLEATIPNGSYTASELAAAVERAMEGASANGVGYVVSYDPDMKRFSLRDDGTLNELRLLWETGAHTGTSVGTEIGFGDSGDSVGGAAYDGAPNVEWNIFRTLIDLRNDIQDNDIDGITQSVTRLETFYDHTMNILSEKIVSKQVQLDMREKIIAEQNLRYEDIRSRLEDADITEAILDLKNKELAYQTALSSAAKLMEKSLLDYLL